MKTTESVKTVETPEEYRLWLEATTDMTAEQIKFSVDAYEKEYFSKKHETNLADEYDKHVEQMQVNGGLSEVAIEAEINAHEKEENVELEEQEEIVTVFNDTNGNPHYVQEIVSILENFYKLEEQRWNIPEEQKTIVSHLLEIAEIEKGDFEKSIVKLREYMDTKEFEQEEKNYAEIFTPILMTSLVQDFDEETHTFTSEKFSYKFSTDELLQKIDISTFDKELIDYKNGILGDSHIFNLGKPSEILQKCGFPPHNRIELASARLKLKSQQTNHPFDIEDIIGLDKALKSPIAVFEYGNKNKSQNVIVNLEKDGKNFLVGVFFNQKRDGFEVSSIRGLFNRDNIDWIRWIEHGKMIYGNKEKIQVSIAQQRTNLADVNNQDVRTSSDTYYLDSTTSILLKFGDVNDIFTEDFEFYKEQKERNEVFKKFRNYYAQNDSVEFDDAKFQSDEFYDALGNKNITILKRYTSFDDNYEISNLAREILSEKLGITEIKTPEELEIYLNQFGTNIKENDMENYVITQERNGEITVLASSYKNAIFVGGDYLSDYETYNLEKVNNLLKDLQESNLDNEYKIMTENDFRQTYLLEENKLSPTEYLTEKINASGINIHLSKEEMKAILEAGKNVQKLAVKYGTNQNIESENENTFNGYGTYVVSVNEENARQLGIKIASRKYGGTFYINNQPLSKFLQEKNFSSYWIKRLEQLNTNSVEDLSYEIFTADVKGNSSLEHEQNTLTSLLNLDLIEFKREEAYLYSVEIPDNDNTNYLLYNNPIGIDQATKINNELQKMGVEWRVSRNDIGKNIYFEVLSKNVFNGNQKLASEFLKENVGFVGMQMDNANYIIFNDKDMSINNKVQYMKSENGEVYGFTFDGEIYIDEDLVNSNVLAHEYTHIWDNYVQKNNPDLWQKGMNCLKGTSLWYEIIEDKNYENLRTDDEILSECHARIVGKMAEQVLERIAARDGELTKDKIIDWDREVSEYVATELLIKPELGDENYISESVKAEYLKEFLSMPMKDLMNEVRIRNFYQSKDIQEMRKNIEALKTPFGQNSKLNYNEWSFARSDEFKKQFGDWESIQKKNFLLSNETVISLTGDEFPKKEGISLTEQVENFFQKNTDNIISPFFGKVSLDKRGLKSSLYHGVNRIKAIAYAAVPEVINNGVIIDKSINHKNRGYDSYVVAAPIKIKEENYICEVVLKKNKNGTEFYLHEVTEQKKYLDRAFVTRRGNSPAQNLGTMVSLLDNIISVNSPVLCPMNENGEPEKSFVENELKKVQKYAESIDNLQTENLEESLDKAVEQMQVNGGMSEAAMEAEIKVHENVIDYEDTIDNEADTYFFDTNDNPHYPQEIVSILENFHKVEAEKWNVPQEEKTAIYHLIQLTEIDKNDFVNSLSKLKNYIQTEEFKREEENYSKIFTPILLTSQGQDFDEKTHTYSSEKFSYKFSTDDLKPAISVNKGEIKSIKGDNFSNINIDAVKELQDKLIKNGKVNIEDDFIILNELEANAFDTKILDDQNYITLNIPFQDGDETKIIPLKYYHISSVEEPNKIIKRDKNLSNEKIENKSDIILGKTIIPKVALITQNGLEEFNEMIVKSYEENTKSYLLVSKDSEGKEKSVRVLENTLKELTSKEYDEKAKKYDDFSTKYDKMLEKQYNDFFELRNNKSYNFRHNLSVFCRKEANSPLDALKIASSLISQMSKEEKLKTKELLNLLRKNGESVNEVIVKLYHDAVKDVPLNENYLNFQRYNKISARPMYDTVSNKGEKIDRFFDAKIGDTVKVNFVVSKNEIYGKKLMKEKIESSCVIISSSVENNRVTLMDDKKSFYDVPRDKFIREYAKYEKKEIKNEKSNSPKKNIMRLDIER